MILFIKSICKKRLSVKTRKKIGEFLWPFISLFRKTAFFLLTSNSFVLRSVAEYIAKPFYELRFFDSIDSYVKTEPDEVEFLFYETVSLFYAEPKYAEENKSVTLNEVNGYKKYGAILKNASVIGGSSLVLLNGRKALYDLYFDTHKKFWYTDSGILYYKNDSCLVSNKRTALELNEAIFLGGNFSWNYYHLLYDILTKHEQFERVSIDLNVPILVDEICLQVPQYKELISILNNSRRIVIPLANGERCRVKRLYHFSSPNVLPLNYFKNAPIKAQDVLFDLSALKYLRDKFLSAGDELYFPSRLFLYRGKSRKGRSYNEDEVFSVLEKYGFVKVSPEKYSIREQVAMFNNAEYIVGGTGAAFSNLLFCKKGCKSLIFSNYKLHLSIFSTIASFVGVDLTYLNDDSKSIEQMNTIHDPFLINPNTLSDLMSKWFA